MTTPPSIEPIPSCPPAPEPQRPQEPRPRRVLPWQFVAASVVLLALVAGGILLVRTKHGTVKIEVKLLDRNAKVEILVDGEEVEIKGLQDPLKFKVGNHRLVVKGPNFETVSETFTVQRGENPILRVRLVPLVGSIALRLDGVPAQAEFRVDGQVVARKQLERPLSLTAGAHRLSVREKDSEDYEATFAVRAGENPPLPVRLAPAFGSVKIQVEGDVDEVTVQVDGQRLERPALAKDLKLRCGSHLLNVTGPTVETLDQPFSVRRGENPVLRVRLTRRLPAVVRYLPAGTQALVSLNVRQLLDSPTVKKYFLDRLRGLLKKNVLARVGLTVVGLDPLKDIERLTLAFETVDAKDLKGLVIVQGRFDETRLHVVMKQGMKPLEEDDGAGGHYRLYELKDASIGQPIYYAVLNETTYVGSTDRAAVREALARAAGRKSTPLQNRVMLDLLAHTDTRQTLWAALAGDLRAGDGMTLRKALGCEGIVGGLTLTGGLKAELEAVASTPAAARRVSEEIVGAVLTDLAKLALKANDSKELEPLVAQLNEIRPALKDCRVHLQGELSAAVVNALLDAAPLAQLFKEMEEALETATKPGKEALEALRFNNAVVEAHGKLQAAAAQFATGTRTPRSPAALVIALRSAGKELAQAVSTVESEMKSWKTPDSEKARLLLTAFQKCLRGYRQMAEKDIAEVIRVVQGRGASADKEERVRAIAERMEAAEKANVETLRQAQKDLVKAHDLSPR